MPQCNHSPYYRQSALVIAVILGLFCAKAAVPFDRIVNYRSTIRVNAFTADGDRLWVATAGGLFGYNRSTGSGTLYSDPVLFPDPEITALCIDARRTLWAGTAKGYLYKRTSAGKQTVVSAYFMAGWSITALHTTGGYLIVGTNNGCSLFDGDKLIALKNSSGFADGFPSRVNTIAICRDTLLLGTGKGIVKLYDTGKTLLETLASANFYDRTIWKFDTSVTSEVQSIVVTQNDYKAMAGPSVKFQNRIVYGDSSTLYADSQKVFSFPSGVTALFSMGGQVCCAGTARSCFYIWDGTNAPRAVRIDGPAFFAVNHIQVDHEGIAWVSPQVAEPFPFVCSWEGFSAFKNGYWHLYSPVDFPSIGSMGQGINKGAAEDCLGRMWFGSDGGSVKRYDRGSNTWQKYCIYGLTQGATFSSNQSGVCTGNWAMSDAITADSTGFLWIVCYNNWDGNLICHDPRFEPDPSAQGYENAHYRRFWPKGDPYYPEEGTTGTNMINTDVANNIIAGYQNGRIVVFRHNGNPLRDGIQITKDFTDNTSLVLDAVSTPDSLTRIVSASGFYTFDARTGKFWKDLCIVSSSSGGPQISVLDTLREISALEAEDEKVLWLGTMNSGVIRYDLTSKSKTIVDETQGLLSNHINDLSLDRKGGFLWIASDRGVSRYAIGYPIGVKNSGPPSVGPNPFSKRRHSELVFGDLAPASTVNVYTVSGTLVASLSPLQTSAHGSVCVWKPPRAIVPGVYVFTIGSTAKKSQGRIIITP